MPQRPAIAPLRSRLGTRARQPAKDISATSGRVLINFHRHTTLGPCVPGWMRYAQIQIGHPILIDDAGLSLGPGRSPLM